jgi:hypothetical protein
VSSTRFWSIIVALSILLPLVGHVEALAAQFIIMVGVRSALSLEAIHALHGIEIRRV